MLCKLYRCFGQRIALVYVDQHAFCFRFPKDEAAKAIWVRSISRHNWAPKKHSHICSKHFTVDSFIPNENAKYRRLKANVKGMPLLKY